MDITALRALEERLAKATGPDRMIDGALFAAFTPWCPPCVIRQCDDSLDAMVFKIDFGVPQSERRLVPHYTASIDAALALVERLLKCSDDGEVLYDLNLTGSLNEPEHCWPAAALRWYPKGSTGPNWHARVEGAPTPALAILRALVAALIAKAGS